MFLQRFVCPHGKRGGCILSKFLSGQVLSKGCGGKGVGWDTSFPGPVMAGSLQGRGKGDGYPNQVTLPLPGWVWSGQGAGHDHLVSVPTHPPFLPGSGLWGGG